MVEEKKDNNGWIEIECGMKQWIKPDESVEGILKGFKDLRFGNKAIIIEDGKDQILIPETIALVGKFHEADIGTEVKIQFTGEQKSDGTGQNFKQFRIFKRPENVI